MSEVSPDLFINAVLGYQKTAAIKAAVALDLFTVTAQHGGAVEPMAAQLGVSARGLRILCNYLTVQGFLEKQDGRYRPTAATATFVTTTSPASLCSIVDFLASPEMIALWLEDPVSYVRKGGAAGLANVAPDNPIWVKFARAMVPLIMPAAQAVAAEIGAWPTPPRRLLDIAAGHGMFGITVAQAVPRLEVTAIDWAGVLAIAEANAAAAGVTQRYRAVAGSAFALDWGGEFDAVLLPNFLHHFDEPTCVGLLEKARDSLAPGGRVVVVEVVPDESRISPSFPGMFGYMMLGSTPSGDAYTERELTEMGRRAGFAASAVRALTPSPFGLLVFE